MTPTEFAARTAEAEKIFPGMAEVIPLTLVVTGHSEEQVQAIFWDAGNVYILFKACGAYARLEVNPETTLAGVEEVVAAVVAAGKDLH